MSLCERPVRSILRAVADAASRWSDADFPPRVRVLKPLCERTGYSEPVVEYALDRLFGAIREPQLAATIEDELGTLTALDGFAPRGRGGRARALPVGRVAVLSSRTTIGVAIVPAVFALCAKCEVTVKDREEGLIGAFFATLREELDEFATAATARSWNGRTEDALTGFDAVVAFGSDATLDAIAATLSAHVRFMPFGSKASAGYVARQALTRERAPALARDAARDLALYETQGCLSLHALFVERGGDIAPQEFAAMLADAARAAAVEFPPGAREPAATAAVAAARDAAAFRAASGSGAVFSDANASFLIALDRPHDRAPYFLPRALPVFEVDAPEEARAYLHAHAIPLEALAVAFARADVTDMAVALRVAQIVPLGTLQEPVLGSFHGGRPRIAPFVTWIGDRS